MNAYVDSSFFVSLYVSDRHAQQAQHLLSKQIVTFLTPLHLAEWTHAVEQHVFRGEISRSEADRLHDRFQQDRRGGAWAEVHIPESAFPRCTELALNYASIFALRTLDTLHVACAMELGAKVFWSFDERQLKLAKACGLIVD